MRWITDACSMECATYGIPIMLHIFSKKSTNLSILRIEIFGGVFDKTGELVAHSGKGLARGACQVLGYYLGFPSLGRVADHSVQVSV